MAYANRADSDQTADLDFHCLQFNLKFCEGYEKKNVAKKYRTKSI